MHKSLLLTYLFTTQVIAGKNQLIWSGVGGNAAHTGYVNTNSDPAKFKVLWQKSFQDPTHFQFTQSDMSVTTDALFITSSKIVDQNDGIYAVNPVTGDVIWKQCFSNSLNRYYISARTYYNGSLYLNPAYDINESWLLIFI